MRCGQCGAESSGSLARCASCGAALPERPSVAAAVLTPPPDGATSLTGADFTLTPLPEGSTSLTGTQSAITGVNAPIADDDAVLTGARELPALDSPTGDGLASSPDADQTHLPSVPPAPGEATGPLTPGEAFGARYHIIRLLGAGGMGAVYQAWDAELGVAVAIKVIRREITMDPTAAAEVERRFKRELLLARQVTHPNVVRIYDLGELNGIKYITMQYVEGADLATILKQSGTLPVSAAMRIAKQIASGLLAAHDAQIVHRDLKPANIVVEEDHAMIMDFGIARSTSSVGGAPVITRGAKSLAGLRGAPAAATMAGAVVGTLEYMAPEQAKAEQVDHRADIYAFGLILSDMLVGRRKSSGAGSAIEELRKRIAQAPPPLRTISADVPEALERIVSTCVEPDPAKRYQTTAELVAELDRLDSNGVPIPVRRVVGMKWVAAGALVAAAIVGLTWYTRPPAETVQPPIVSVLVADFDNQTGDTVFDGTLEPAVMQGIEAASFVAAFPRNDARRLATRIRPGSKLDENTSRLLSIREGINRIITGSIQSSGQGYQVSLRLIDPAAEGTALASFQESVSSKQDVLRTIASISGDVRQALGDTDSHREEGATSETFTAASLEAAREYTLGNDLGVQQKYEEAIVHYKRATELDPNLGRAYSGWALAAGQLGRKDESNDLWKRALPLIDRMNEREKFRTLGMYASRVTRNQDQAIEMYSQLIRKYPADGAGHNNLALAYFRKLQFQKAYDEGQTVLSIYPKILLYRNNHVLYAMYAGEFEKAAAESKKIVDEVPGSSIAYLPLAIGSLASGNVAEARRVYEEMKKTDASGASAAAMGLADIAMMEGRYADAETILKAGVADDQASKNIAGEAAKLNALAETYLAQGRTALAVKHAQDAAKLGNDPAFVVPAASVLLRGGREADAKAIASNLGASLEPQRRAYGKIIEGQIAIRNRRMAEGVDAFRAALTLADLWMAHSLLGVAYVEADSYAEALTELDMCFKRRGEATSIFIDDIPSFRYAGPLAYWLGRAQEGMGSKPAAVENYNKFIASRPGAPNDPLVADARKRIAR